MNQLMAQFVPGKSNHGYKLLLVLILCFAHLQNHPSSGREINLPKKSNEVYNLSRIQLLEDDQKTLLGASIKLEDPREVKVNEILMSYKDKEFNEGILTHGRFFPAAQHFFKARESIERSNVFKIIKMVPKGANLHMHLNPSMNQSFLIQNLTKWPNLYYCYNDPEDHLLFLFTENSAMKDCGPASSWKKVEDLYKGASSERLVQDWIRSAMDMNSLMDIRQLMNGKEVWALFEKKIRTVGSLAKYEKAMRVAFYQILEEHYNDNIMYVEVRSTLRKIHRLDQSQLSPKETVEMFQQITNEFMKTHPDFWGVKFIYAPHRFNSFEEIQQYLKQSVEFEEQYPDFFAGFDLVGQEDRMVALTKFLPLLLKAKENGVNFFFHSGETNWFGTTIDENLVDAILLNTSRFGHGLALYRHPLLYEIAKNKSIAVEVCPISNQILRHVEDLRLHPAQAYFKDGFPVVVGGDDAGMWGAAPLSHDWYIAFMAIGGQKADLRFLKQLAINSIKYSAMSKSEKESALTKWNAQWSKFLDKVINLFGESLKH